MASSDLLVNISASLGVFLARMSEHGGNMGFLSRLLVPRGVRRAMHPVRTAKRAATPKAIKKAQRALHPVDNLVYRAERPVITSLRSGGKRRQKGRVPVYRHGNCPVAHRSPEAAAKCRNR